MPWPGCTTHATYAAGCPQCRAISNRTSRRRYYAIKAGTHQPTVNAEMTREHIARLHEAGLRYQAIADKAGVAKRTVQSIVHGEHAEIRGVTADAILGIPVPTSSPPPPLRRTLRPTVGTTRRIRALVAAGHSMFSLDRQAGWNLGRASNLAAGRQPTVDYNTHETAVTLYARLSMVPGGSERARRIGQRKGWLPPAWWDDERLDEETYDPLAEAQAADTSVVDEVSVDRALSGKRVKLSKAERHAAVLEGLRRGRALTDVALVLRMNYDTAKKLAAQPLPAMAA